jgi:IS605 OrfB family transposase
MSILTYVKGLPTPASELNALGMTELEMFLEAFAPIFRSAAIETVNHLLSEEAFNKSVWNTHLQQTFGINKRHANGVIAYAKGKVDSAKECRANHIKTLESKAKSIEAWSKKQERKLKLARKFYAKKKWQASKTGCNFPLSCSVQYRKSNWNHLKFQIHYKKRRLAVLQQQIQHLNVAPVHVSIPHDQVFIVGSSDETDGNQVAQWDGTILKIRVPSCLESRFGQSVVSEIGDFERKHNRLPEEGTKTWHLYKKYGHWNAALQFTPAPVQRQSKDRAYGCIGIDLNPGSIGWAYVDLQGNLKAKGQIPLLMGLPQGKQQAQIVKACLELVKRAVKYACPIVCEELDLSAKKERLGKAGRKYARMLSSWAYREFFKQLGSILANRGIDLITVNPAYSSLMGLAKYMKMYGLANDEAAGLVIARRGMGLKERLPDSITAYAEVNSDKHEWSQGNQLNKLSKRSSTVNR